MKVGIRTPSPEKSIKARTTGRVKRKVKSSINPLYGKKGMGYVRDPERAIKNKVYHAVTIDPLESLKKGHKSEDKDEAPVKHSAPSKGLFAPMILFYVLGIIFTTSAILILLLNNRFSLFSILAAAASFVFFIIFYERRNG